MIVSYMNGVLIFVIAAMLSVCIVRLSSRLRKLNNRLINLESDTDKKIDNFDVEIKSLSHVNSLHEDLINDIIMMGIYNAPKIECKYEKYNHFTATYLLKDISWAMLDLSKKVRLFLDGFTLYHHNLKLKLKLKRQSIPHEDVLRNDDRKLHLVMITNNDDKLMVGDSVEENAFHAKALIKTLMSTPESFSVLLDGERIDNDSQLCE